MAFTPPITVAYAVSAFDRDPVLLAAAHLHEVVENIDVSARDLESDVPMLVVRLIVSQTPRVGVTATAALPGTINQADLASLRPSSTRTSSIESRRSPSSFSSSSRTKWREKESLIDGFDCDYPRLKQRAQQYTQTLIANLECALGIFILAREYPRITSGRTEPITPPSHLQLHRD